MQTEFIHIILQSLYRRRKSVMSSISLCSTFTAILLLLSILYSTLHENSLERSKAIYGSWNFAVYNTSEQTLDLLQTNALIAKLGTMTINGTITDPLSKKKSYIGSVDSNTRSLISVSFEQGRYPESTSEIALEKELLLTLGIDETIGTEVIIPCTDASGTTKTLKFRLCGIINSYHNTYLTQGPLVSAFISTTYHSALTDTLYINNFVGLMEGYTKSSVVAELHNAIIDKNNTTSEHWYYNTYIESSLELPYTILFLELGIGILLLSTIYHSFLIYYTKRYKTLVASQILCLDQKKIKKIFGVEFLFLILVSTIIGCIETGVVLLLVFLFQPALSIYISIRALLINLVLSDLCIILINLISRIHSLSLSTRTPVVHLPAISIKPLKRYYNRFFYLIKRILVVYKRTIFYYIGLYSVLICTIAIFITTSYYSYKSYKQLSVDPVIDYSIKNLTDLCKIQSELAQIQKLADVETLSYYEYLIIDSTIVIKLPNKQSAPKKNYCYIPPHMGGNVSSLLAHQNNLILHTREKNISLTIDTENDYNYTGFESSSVDSNYMYVYCNSETFHDIIKSSGIIPYYYITILYTKNCDSYVVTNIIDTILFGTKSIQITHNLLENERELTLILLREGVITIFCVLNFLVTIFFLKNQQRAGLHYLEKEIRIVWSLGLDKRSIKIYLLALNLLFMTISYIISIVVVFLYHIFRGTYSDWFYSYTIKYFYMTPRLFLLLWVLIVIYSVIYLYYLTKDIDEIIKKF